VLTAGARNKKLWDGRSLKKGSGGEIKKGKKEKTSI